MDNISGYELEDLGVRFPPSLLSPGSSVGSSVCLKNRRSSDRDRPGGLAHCPIAQWQSDRLLSEGLQVQVLLGQPFIAGSTNGRSQRSER